MKVRNIKHRYTYFDGYIAKFGVWPFWRVMPPSGYKWVGIELVRRK